MSVKPGAEVVARGKYRSSLPGHRLVQHLAGVAASFNLHSPPVSHEGIAAGTRVLVVAVVRDRFQGSAMAQTMSIVMIIFAMASFGAGAVVGRCPLPRGWRYIFLDLAAYGLILGVWGDPAGARRPFPWSPPAALRHIAAAATETLTIRASSGNTSRPPWPSGPCSGCSNRSSRSSFDVISSRGCFGLTFALIAGPI